MRSGSGGFSHSAGFGRHEGESPIAIGVGIVSLVALILAFIEWSI